jgi:hypothetical protein
MKLVAIVRAPADVEAAASLLAEASGLALAEARMRLAPEPPALLARLEPDKTDLLVGQLRKGGLAALAIPVTVPTDKDRVVARTVSLDDAGATFTARSGESARIAWRDVTAILRGLRSSRSEVERTEKSTSFSLGKALATSGLMMTRTSTRTVRSSEETTEQIALVYSHGGRVALLAERELDFSCLGPGMGPSSTANMVEMARRLRAKATSAFYDERLLRLGRRPLPFLARGESRSQTATTTVTRADTSSALDVLAEVLHRALLERLLP